MPLPEQAPNIYGDGLNSGFFETLRSARSTDHHDTWLVRRRSDDALERQSAEEISRSWPLRDDGTSERAWRT
jgi:hypothetical protein